MKRRRWVAVGILAVPAILVGGGAAFLLRDPAIDTRPHPFNQDRNGAWMEHRWLTRPQTREEMAAALRDLARRGVTNVFPHLIPFDREGRLPGHDRDQMRAFIAVAREVAPRMRVLPWVGGLRVGYRRSVKGSIDLGDLRQRQRIVAECRGLLDEGFDGIHLNIEPVPSGSDEFLALLRALRPAMGESGILSVSAQRPAPFALPFAPNYAWTTEYYARVASTVDQVVVMAYDTGLPTASLYRRYMAYTAGAATRALKPSLRGRVLIGVPTYDPAGLMHRAGVETLENALLGTIAGLRGSDAGGTIEGVALYAHWTTDPEEWRVYERLWRGGASPAH
jgi:hypothetical protein